MKIRLALGIFLGILGTTLWWSSPQAQDQEAACKASCQEQQQYCIQACSEHPDPVECDANCRDALRDCRRRCE